MKHSSYMFGSVMLLQSAVVFCTINLVLIKALPSSARSDDLNPSTSAIIEGHGYTAETHHVTTDDGYILEIHRIPYGRDGPSSERGPPVFLMHGLLGASNNFVAIGPENSIGFNLADAGFDVWMGNARGNKDSRRHVTLDPDGEEDKFKFWDFSWEEIGLYDIPAMTDYVRASTGFDKIHYIGHSQGGTVFFVLNSMRPEYNENFASAHFLGPASYKGHFPNTLLSATALLVDTIYSTSVRNGFVEVGEDILSLLSNNNVENAETDVLTTVVKEIRGENDVSRGPADPQIPNSFGGAALKQVAHYGQNVRSRNFQRWDYGLLRNREVYGSLRPPQYDLSLVTVESTIHYTTADTLVGVGDILELARVMPNAVARRLDDDEFTHVGFAFDPSVRELVTNYIIKRLKERLNM